VKTVFLHVYKAAGTIFFKDVPIFVRVYKGLKHVPMELEAVCGKKIEG
jgi:hypothetical protein